tara:strand:- start:649 stop:969 length:321 start_codon:yes stop_codon:yes gene_type:complete
MKDKYTRSFSITANTHNIRQHDAVMITPTAQLGHTRGFTAELVPYGDGTQYGAGGKPINNTLVGPTGTSGDTIPYHGGTHDGGPIIIPLQCKSVLNVTNCTVHGLN